MQFKKQPLATKDLKGTIKAKYYTTSFTPGTFPPRATKNDTATATGAATSNLRVELTAQGLSSMNTEISISSCKIWRL